MKRRKVVRLRNNLFPIIVMSILVIGGGSIATIHLWANTSLATINQENNSIVYPTLYSDKNINESAKVSDERFRNTASIPREESLANLFSLLLTKKEPLASPKPEEYGTWLWTPLLMITPEYRESIILGAKRNGVKTIYLSIDSYLDIYTLPEGEEKEKLKKEFDTALEIFVLEANRHGLSVDAEAGWRNWAEPGHEYKAFAILEYVKNYNDSGRAKLRGFQYDVEPYMLSYYKENKKEVLHRFITLMHESAKKLAESDLQFSVVIPEFYDGYKKETPKFFYALKYGHTVDHLVRVLELKPGSSIIVMAYRNFAEGNDGAIHIAEDEIESAKNSQTRVVVAQEVGDVPPPYITFHNTSLSHYQEQLEIIKNKFSGVENFGGVSAHYINALLALE